MRKLFPWLAVTLIVSALATAAVANYVQNHPTSTLALCVTRAAALCVAAPTAARQPASPPAAIVSLDAMPLPDAIIDLSPELKSACDLDVAELRAISELGHQPPRVVCAVPEDEFTFPTLPPAAEEVVAEEVKPIIFQYCKPLPTGRTWPRSEEAIDAVPTPMDTSDEPSEPLPMPRSFDIDVNFEATDTPAVAFDFGLPFVPCGTAPCVGVFNFVRQMVGSCVQCLADGCCCEKSKCGKERATIFPCINPVVEVADEPPCEDCHLDLKNVLILVADPGVMPGFGCFQRTAAFMPPPAAGCVAGVCGVHMCAPPPPFLACQACLPCCEQTKLVRKVYPVAGLMDPNQRGSEEDVVRIICRTVCPASWEPVGGCGVIDYFALGKCLVVLQTEEVHAEIDQLLAELRATMDSSSGAQAASQAVQFATYVVREAVEETPACRQAPCCHESSCPQTCCKEACITIHVTDAACCLGVCRDENGQTCLCCKGLRLCVPSGCCRVKVISGCAGCAKEGYRPWYECGDEVECVPYVPVDSVADGEFEELVRHSDRRR